VKIWTASAALAAATGPVIGGLLVQLSWRCIFLVNIPVGLLAIALAVRFVPNVQRDLGARIPDLPWLLVCIGFALAMPTVTASGTAELPDDQSATGSAVVNMYVQVGLVVGISILVAVLGVASDAARLSVFQTAWWIAAGIVLAAGGAAVMVTPRHPLSVRATGARRLIRVPQERA